MTENKNNKKVSKIARKKRSTKILMITMGLIGVLFYAVSMGIESMGVSWLSPTLIQWGKIFITIAFVIFMMLILSKKNKNSIKAGD